MTVTPASDTLLIGSFADFTVVAKDSNGAVLSGRTVTWRVDDTALASNAGTNRLVARKFGTVRLIATAEGVSDTATALLTAVVKVGRLFPSLFAGDTTLLVATTTDAAGAPVSTPAVVWSSANIVTATVSPAGVVSGQAAGMVGIRASLPGAVDSQVVAVLAPHIGTIRELLFSHDTFSSTAFSFVELWTSQPDGSGAHLLTTQDFSAQMAAWSPDGAKIAFAGGQVVGTSGTLDLYTLNFNGTGLDSLGLSGLLPSWSPDATQLAVYDGLSVDIAVVSATGVRAPPLATGPGVDTWPTWSPDGRQIAWRKDLNGGSCDELWLMGADGSSQRKLPLPAGAFPCQFAWAPDGKELAVTLYNGVWLVRPDGTGLHAITPNCSLGGGCPPPGYDGIVWNPQGTKLAFYGFPDGSSSSVNVVNRDGTGFVTASYYTANNPTYPQWSPDGQRLAFQASDPADSTTAPIPYIIFTTDANLQNLQYGRPGIRTINPRWRP